MKVGSTRFLFHFHRKKAPPPKKLNSKQFYLSLSSILIKIRFIFHSIWIAILFDTFELLIFGHIVNYNYISESFELQPIEQKSNKQTNLHIVCEKRATLYNPLQETPSFSNFQDAQVPKQPQQNPSHSCLGLMTENVWS